MRAFKLDALGQSNTAPSLRIYVKCMELGVSTIAFVMSLDCKRTFSFISRAMNTHKFVKDSYELVWW